jgi:hypothetical protein
MGSCISGVSLPPGGGDQGKAVMVAGEKIHNEEEVGI